MSPLLQPWHILLACHCCLVNQRQQQIIEFQNAQVEALLKQLGSERLLLDDDQRRLLAVKAYGIEPAPDRQPTPAWSTFLKAHWNSIFATDFTTVEVETSNAENGLAACSSSTTDALPDGRSDDSEVRPSR